MPAREVKLGPIGETVRAMIRGAREMRGLRLKDVAESLVGTPRPLSVSTLSQIELGTRRVDVDDLVAIARALEVDPGLLLFPPVHGSGDAATSRSTAAWLRADHTTATSRLAEYATATTSAVARSMEEQERRDAERYRKLMASIGGIDG